MSKQSFTTGQVLTAAQVNSLQANDYNQTVSVKTASYVLVAADKGTRIEFNTSGSVTCTVNTGLFDAGDTLVIQNRGAGAVTVTPGTATVNTSATLVLSQYDAGTLYFISASAAIFFNTDAGGGSPLTTKGDLYGFSTSDARIPIGANATVLTADSNESLGLKWAMPAAGGGLTLINTGGTALSGSSTTYSSIPTTYKNLIVIARNFYVSSANANGAIRFNSDTSSTYSIGAYRITSSAGNVSGGNQGADRFYLMEQMGTTDTDNFAYFIIPDYANADTHKVIEGVTKYQTGDSPGVDNARFFYGMWTTAPAAITSLTFISSANWSGGTFFIYGES